MKQSGESRSNGKSTILGRVKVVVNRIPYVVDYEQRQVLRDNIYLDAIAAREIIRQAVQAGALPART
jgi:hypothetical protein